ncbi:MAG: hypothetical protein M1832_000402 [Thelocarpon impressellum]|nr:MAG: hypothetical protein M1832_000402 [Thelocarpon impressellum]
MSGPSRLAQSLPSSVVQTVLSYVDAEDAKAMSLACRSWSVHVPKTFLPEHPITARTPAEILQHIYQYLDPVDFNTARHTCRAWMLASLQRTLLMKMLKRGGWWSGVLQDLLHAEISGSSGQVVSEEWIMSKRLARECSLGPDWLGSGLRSGDSFTQEPNPASQEKAGMSQTTGLSIATAVDFSELGPRRFDEHGSHGPAATFTVSVCGNYLMALDGCKIYVYQLRNVDGARNPRRPEIDEFPWPVTRIVCPREVLAVSMDTSSQRYAVAILLEGRMGLVCDLDERTNHLSQSSTRSWSRLGRGSGSGSGSQESFHASSWAPSFALRTTDQFIPHPRSEAVAAGIRGAYRDGVWSLEECEAWCMPSSWGGTNFGAAEQALCSEADQRLLSMGVHSGAQSVYRHLCSDEDPPRSVSICPQRKCVAYGCAGGIELHWVDAVTGQDLNRWFPLNAPSDYLYFLPPRPGVDSAKKLRLISSAAHPKERPTLPERFQRTCAPCWTNMAFAAHLSAVQTASSDHYHAVPLRDGHHILFTDPQTGVLCVGSDAPLGAPNKLVRKMMLRGPDGALPCMYASGEDLRWGIRVVAGYEDRVVLFSIPPDVLNASNVERATMNDHADADDEGSLPSTSNPVATSESTVPNMTWIDGSEATDRPLWPVQIRGVEIGQVAGLAEVAMDSGPSPKVWAFGKHGTAYQWRLRDDAGAAVKERIALRDGTMVNATDADGDAFMRLASRTPEAQYASRPSDSMLSPPISRTRYFGQYSDGPADDSNDGMIIDLGEGDEDDGDVIMLDVEPYDVTAETAIDDGDEGYWSDDADGEDGGVAYRQNEAELCLSSSSAEWVVGFLRPSAVDSPSLGMSPEQGGSRELDVDVGVL